MFSKFASLQILRENSCALNDKLFSYFKIFIPLIRAASSTVLVDLNIALNLDSLSATVFVTRCERPRQ